MPGGGLLPEEDYTSAAVREVREETGIKTINYSSYILGNFMPRRAYLPNLEADVFGRGIIKLHYTDSEKKYEGRLVRLRSESSELEPTEQPESDLHEPQYMLLAEAIRRKGEFTPACQFLLELVQEAENIR